MFLKPQWCVPDQNMVKYTLHRAEYVYNLGIILGDDFSHTSSFRRIGRDKWFWYR